MTDLAKFDKAVNDAVREVVDGSVRDMHHHVLRAVHERAVSIDNAAMLTGFYRANIKVSLQRSGDVDLDPPVRESDERLRYLDDVVANAFREGHRALQADPYTPTRVATAVSYAPELEQRDRTFQRAADEGAELGAQRARRR